MSADRDEVARLLRQWSSGDENARERLIASIYAELRALAGGFMRRERANHTLQPTALANEALMRLYDQRVVPQEGKRELMGLVAQLMRRVLVDHARRKQAQRRGAGRTMLTFVEEIGEGAPGGVDVLELDLVLARLAEMDQRQARVVELRAFGGFEVSEVAEMLEVSEATVKRDWRMAKMWLYRELKR